MLSIDYRLDGAGWATCVIRPEGAAEIVLDNLSYLDEPLWDLLKIGLDCALQTPGRELVFDNEGSWTRLRVERLNRDEESGPVPVRVEVAVDRGETGVWTPLGAFDSDSETLARAILTAAEGVLERHGLEGYDREWCMEGFPLRALLALRAALSVEPPVGERRR